MLNQGKKLECKKHIFEYQTDILAGLNKTDEAYYHAHQVEYTLWFFARNEMRV